jgi:UDPglucose 6-dehydrogenase
VSTFSNALNGSDMAIIVTDWPEFKGLVHAENLMKMNTAIIFDGRNMFTMDEIRKVSVQRPLHYQSVGRPVVSSLNKRRDSRQINKAFY